MCLNPIPIRNSSNKTISRVPVDARMPFYALRDSVYSNLYVPCGHCVECREAKQHQYITRVCTAFEYSSAIFFTFTVSDHWMCHVEKKGIKVDYIPLEYLVKFLKRFLMACPWETRHFIVQERGTLRHRPHYHGFFFIPKVKGEELEIQKFRQWFDFFVQSPRGWSVNVGTKHKPVYKSLCDFSARSRNGRRPYNSSVVDFSESAKSVFYASKYITGFDSYCIKLQMLLKSKLLRKDYEDFWKKIRPRVHCSHFLGLEKVENGHFVLDTGKVDRRVNDNSNNSEYLSFGTRWTQFGVPPLWKQYLKTETLLNFLKNRKFVQGSASLNRDLPINENKFNFQPRVSSSQARLELIKKFPKLSDEQ